jgi:hypothetical protein
MPGWVIPDLRINAITGSIPVVAVSVVDDQCCIFATQD